MYSKSFALLASLVMIFATSACNTGSDTATGADLQAFGELTEAVNWHGAPPTCYGLRHYYKWVCSDGDWALKKVGQRDIWCDGNVFVTGDETDCYSDFATYDCDSGGSCGSYNHVCPPHPLRFCRRPIFQGPQDLAP
jgi:hypothetical protein